MIDTGKKNLIGVYIDAVDYEGALERIAVAARDGSPLAVSALAVHGVMTGYSDPGQRLRLNRLDMVVPDGQPVRWALNMLHGAGLPDRVYGPTLMLKVCELATREGLGIFLYGSTAPVIERLAARLRARLPALHICGAEPSRFRRLSGAEKDALVARIHGSGARITFVGLGCPRQEIWAYEYRESLAMPVLAVGAAFDFHAGVKPQAPHWMQDRGLEWLFRLGCEPTRLWQRYLVLNPWYVSLVAAQALGLRHFPPVAEQPIEECRYG